MISSHEAARREAVTDVLLDLAKNKKRTKLIIFFTEVENKTNRKIFLSSFLFTVKMW